MKWIRPSGKEIETNDEKGTTEYCMSMKWKKAPPPIVIPDPPPATPAEVRMGAVDNAVILIMEAGDKDALMDSGAPKVEAIVTMLEYPVTSVERDAAYVRWQESIKGE